MEGTAKSLDVGVGSGESWVGAGGILSLSRFPIISWFSLAFFFSFLFFLFGCFWIGGYGILLVAWSTPAVMDVKSGAGGPARGGGREMGSAEVFVSS